VVRVHPATGPWWKEKKANALERNQYHPSLASLLGKVVAGWHISCREDGSRRRLLVAEAVETNGAELKVNDTGKGVPLLLLPAERQLVEASVEEAHNERRSWTRKKDLDTLVLEVDGVNSGFRRSREQVAVAAKNLVRKLKKQRTGLVSVCKCTSARVCGCADEKPIRWLCGRAATGSKQQVAMMSARGAIISYSR
jgi:hypothetical protein